MTCSPNSKRSLAAKNSEGRVKSQRVGYSVIPANPGSGSGTGAGIQEKQALLDPVDPVPAKAGNRGDGFGDFLQTH
jgi:hypothetical protein